MSEPTPQTPPKHWCPVCDAGWVEPVCVGTVLQPGQWQGELCGECEAWWPQPHPHNQANRPEWVQFSQWLSEAEITPAELVITRL